MAFELGVISDTHGLLRPEAMAALQGCGQIIHPGDVHRDGLLEQWRESAPTAAVRGNWDRGAWAEALPPELFLTAAGVEVYVVHNLHDLAFDPAARGIGMVVSGHSHKPVVERRGGVWFLNPGSAGRRRFSLPTTLARVQIGGGGEIAVRLVDLLAPPAQ